MFVLIRPAQTFCERIKVDFVTDDTPSNSASGSCAWRSRVQMACKVVLARYVNGTAIPNSLRRSAQIHRGWLRTYRSSTRVNVKVLDFLKSGGGYRALPGPVDHKHSTFSSSLPSTSANAFVANIYVGLIYLPRSSHAASGFLRLRQRRGCTHLWGEERRLRRLLGQQ